MKCPHKFWDKLPAYPSKHAGNAFEKQTISIMKNLLAIYFLIPFLFMVSYARSEMSYFLPDNVTYNKKIPTPEEFFGYEPGQLHLTHDQVLNYMVEIAGLSERAIIEEYARSYENRPLVHLIFSSEENHKNLEKLKQAHISFSEPGSNISIKDVPLVITLGYGVHGNESSATNSSVITAYYLAAAQGDKIDSLLANTIILVDPCLNPDGFTRHSTWANMHQSQTVVPGSESRQFAEVWPGGRGNHYWFDLNRDYILLVNPETKGRVAKLHEWKPNIVTDHHEMASSSTFFFQPGVPSRNNPWTPENNYILTKKIAAYHANYLDKIGTYYFSEERFDDFYFGKGSSYPDINSGVGILFEQAGFRGRERETPEGIKTFAYAIKNQFTVTLSTLDAAMNFREDLLQHQQAFYIEALALAENDPVKGYVFGDPNNKALVFKFINLLKQHQIQVSEIKEDITINGKTFHEKTSFAVSLNQNQYRLIKSFFEESSSFKDTTFYDVSTWTLPYAFNMPFEKLPSKESGNIGGFSDVGSPSGNIFGSENDIGFAFSWNSHFAPKALYQLQQKGVDARVATSPFTIVVDGTSKVFKSGSILITSNNQPVPKKRLSQIISEVANNTGIHFYGLKTGLTETGIDMGSGGFSKLKKPKVLMLVGNSVNSRDAGEIWHLFDQEYHIPVTMLDIHSFNRASLEKYNTIILPDGLYEIFGEKEAKKIKAWVKAGGTLVACKNAAKWVASNQLANVNFKNPVAVDSTFNQRYADKRKNYSLNVISGSIFQTEIDVTHPLCYGYVTNELPIFKSGSLVAVSTKIPYAEPVKFTQTPYISGYVSEANLNRIANSPVVFTASYGRGRIINYYENMNFRGIWLGTSKLFSNAVFFGPVIR